MENLYLSMHSMRLLEFISQLDLKNQSMFTKCVNVSILCVGTLFDFVEVSIGSKNLTHQQIILGT